MPYHVVPLTMAQVRLGALAFQRELVSKDSMDAGVRVYAVSPFDLDERRRFKDRFGGDIVYFFNEAAYAECVQRSLDLKFVAVIEENELPRKKSLVIGKPDAV